MVGLHLTCNLVEWVNEDGGSHMASDITDLCHLENMGLGATDVSFATSVCEDATESALLSPSLSASGLDFTSRPGYTKYPCVNDKEAYGGLCTSGEKVRGERLKCGTCINKGRGGRGPTHSSNDLLPSDMPITYTKYPCPNKSKYDCTLKVNSPRALCPICIKEGRPLPASMSIGTVQDIHAVEGPFEESDQDSDDDKVLLDHE